MHDEELILEILNQIYDSTQKILQRFEPIKPDNCLKRKASSCLSPYWHNCNSTGKITAGAIGLHRFIHCPCDFFSNMFADAFYSLQFFE